MIHFSNSLHSHTGSTESLSGGSSQTPKLSFIYNPTDNDFNQISTSTSFDKYEKHTSGDEEDEEDLTTDYENDEDEQQVEAVEKSPYEMILGFRVNDDESVEYFVKKRNRPYRDCEWISKETYLLYPNANQALKRYHRRVLYPPEEP